jgi:hypothetical protein
VSKALAGAQISLRKTLSDLKQAAYKAGCEISGLAIHHSQYVGLHQRDVGYDHRPYQYRTNTSLSDDFWTVRTLATAAFHANA